jgi:putative phosphoesterase
MRLAVLADIHGNLPALEAVVRDFSRRGVDAVVNLGDSVSGPLMPLETARFLMAQDWMHIAGNHERQLLSPGAEPRGPSDEFAHAHLTAAELEWLASLKPTVRFSRDVVLCHGTPRSDSEYFLETVEPSRVRAATSAEVDERLGKVDANLIVCGHTHTPRSVRASTGQLIVNPGSVGLPAYEDVVPYPHVIETGSPDARYAVVERLKGDWIAELITVSYAHEAMANLAERHGRPDWAHALATGYV